MPEPAAAATQPAVPAAEQPAEGQPVTLVRGPKGRFQKAKSSKPFEERMAAMDVELERRGVAKVEGDGADETDSDDEPESPAPAAKSEPGKVDDKTPPKARRETVTADNGTVLGPDKAAADKAIEKDLAGQRVKFNEWKRKELEIHQRKLAEDRQRFQAELQAERAKFTDEVGKATPRMEKAERVLQLMETADYENLAKEAGYDDWEKFQGHVMGVITDPNYKRTRELERKLAEREAKEKRDAEELTARQQREREETERRTVAQQRAQKINEHKKGLSEAMAKSQDRTVAAMADDPVFINTVFEIQRQNYDPSTDSTVSPEQAVKMALRGAQRTIREDLRALRDRLMKADLDDPEQAAAVAAVAAAVNPAAAAPTAPKPKPNKTAVIPASATPEASAAGRYRGTRDPAWRQRFADEMGRADEDEEERTRQRVARQASR